MTEPESQHTSLATLVTRIATLLTARGETLAVAETSAGGLIHSSCVQIPGASAWFLGGAVAYSAAARQGLLGVKAYATGSAGVVSNEMAKLLAETVQRKLHADWAIAETGIAGPQTGRRSSKPVGSCHIGITGPRGTHVVSINVTEEGREENMAAFTYAALAIFLQILQEEPPSKKSIGRS